MTAYKTSPSIQFSLNAVHSRPPSARELEVHLKQPYMRYAKNSKTLATLMEDRDAQDADLVSTLGDADNAPPTNWCATCVTGLATSPKFVTPTNLPNPGHKNWPLKPSTSHHQSTHHRQESSLHRPSRQKSQPLMDQQLCKYFQTQKQTYLWVDQA